MGLRTVGDPFGGPARLVDKLIGEAYSNVKLVADNMAAVIAASAFAAAVAAAASAAATSASTATSSATTATTAAAAALVSNTAAAGSATAASGSASGASGSAITASTAASGAATSAASAASSLASLLAVNPLSTTVGTLQTIASPISVNGTFQSNGTLGVANTINLGTGVGAGGTTTIQTPNGSHINLSPQGSAHVKISGGNGTLDTGIINIGNITFPIASGNVVPILSVAAGLTGNITQAGYFGWNTISASSDDAHCTGSGNVFNDLFIAHNFGGPNYRGFRQGLAVSFTQTADITSSSGFEVISGAGFGVNLMKTWGGTGLTIANARGYATCLNPYLTFGGTFTNGGGGSAMEIDVSGHAGSSFLDKVGLLITLDSSDTVQGTLGDAALTFANQTIQGAGRGWKALISVGSYGGYFAPATDGAFWIIAPNSSGDTLVVNKGLSWANGTFTTSAIETPGFTLSGVGKVTLSSAGTALAVTNNATIGGTASFLNNINQVAGGQFNVTTGNQNNAASLWNYSFIYAGNAGGAGAPLSANAYVNSYNILDQAYTTGVINGWSFEHDVAANGNSASGSRTALTASLIFRSGGTVTASGINSAGVFNAIAATNLGGTATKYAGSLNGFNVVAHLQAGATYVQGYSGIEIDSYIDAGITYDTATPLLIVVDHNSHGRLNLNNGIEIGAESGNTGDLWSVFGIGNACGPYGRLVYSIPGSPYQTAGTMAVAWDMAHSLPTMAHRRIPFAKELPIVATAITASTRLTTNGLAASSVVTEAILNTGGSGFTANPTITPSSTLYGISLAGSVGQGGVVGSVGIPNGGTAVPQGVTATITGGTVAATVSLVVDGNTLNFGLNSAVNVDATVTAYSTAGDGICWKLNCGAVMGGTPGTTAIIGSPTWSTAWATAGAAAKISLSAPTADTTLGAINLTAIPTTGTWNVGGLVTMTKSAQF